MSYKICNIKKDGSNESVLYKNVRIPIGFYHNAKGLLGTKELKENTGMLFKNCNSIHMLGMKIPLDIIFLKEDGTIVKCVNNLKPWKIAFCMKAKMTLELPSGSIKKVKLKPNIKLEIMDE
jgi:uncharacterized membrane protein (UPF0127 family)